MSIMDEVAKPEPSGRLCALNLPSTSACRLVKWVAEPGSRVRKGTVLVTYTTDLSSDEPENEVPLKSTLVGVVKEKLFEEGSVVEPGVPVAVLEDKCDHSIVVYDMCTDCGCNLRSQSGGGGGGEKELATVTVVHGIPGIRISQKEAEALGHKDKFRLLKSRKLALIVDLDQTLIHTSVDPNIEPGLQDVFGFKLPGHPMIYHCRLRPFARQFLEKISKLYELHVFTMGTNSYAANITKILDPERKLFCDRIISRDECFDPFSKVLRLKSVFPCGDEMVAIIDDREDVWSRCPNLIHVKPYVFFAGTADINAPPTRPSAPPTANTMDSSKADSLPFKVHQMTSSRNNNIRPPVTMTTHHHQSAPEANLPRQLKDNNVPSVTTVDNNAPSTGASVEATTQSTATMSESNLQDSTPQLDNDHSVHVCKTSEEYEVKSNEPLESSPVCESEKARNDCTVHSNSNENSNNNNGGDPQNTDNAKEDDSSSSSSSSSSSEGEDEEDERERNGDLDDGRESSSSSSSSGIDDNLFDNLEDKSEDVASASGEAKAEDIVTADGTRSARVAEKLRTGEIERVNVIKGVVTGEPTGGEDGGIREEVGGVASDAPGEGHVEGGSGEMEVDTAQLSKPTPVAPSQSNTNQINTIRRRSVEVKDPDTFLLYLGDILEAVHDRFYKEFDEMAKDVDIEEMGNIPTPDMKKIIPEMRHSVLKGTRILFTGVIPTNMPPHKNREWNTARAFGAIIHDRLVPGLHSADPNKAFRATTHVIAGRPGTSKLREAKKLPSVKVVNPRWLWACAEQWKLVDEKLYPVQFDKEKGDEKHHISEGVDKLESTAFKPPRKVMKIIHKESDHSPLSTVAIPAGHQPVAESELMTETPQEPTNEISAKTKADNDSDSDSEDDDDAFEVGGKSDRDLEKDSAMLQRLREFKRHMSLESRLSVSDEELEKMDAEVEAEISSSSSNSSDHGEDLGTFIEERDEDSLLSYESYVGSEGSNENRTGAVVARLSRKRKHVDTENNSSSSNSPSLEQLLNDSVEPSDEEDNSDNDSDDSIDELGALLG